MRTVEREDVGRDVVERLRSPDELGELLYDLDVLGELLYDLDELGELLYDLDEPADGDMNDLMILRYSLSQMMSVHRCS